MTQKPENILKRKVDEMRQLAREINAPGWLIEELINVKRVAKVQFRAHVGGEYKIFTAIRVHHRNPHATGARPYKGGFRYHPGVTEELLTVLAMDMTEKCVLAGLPFGGAKGGIALDPLEYSHRELREITEKMVEEMVKTNNIPHPDIDSFGPDVGTNPEMMYWMYNTVAEMNHLRNLPNVPAAITGKPVDQDGISGREDATSHGLLLQLEELMRLRKLELSHPDNPTVAIQGFGNVGYNAARLASSDRFPFTVSAVSDKRGGIYRPDGLNMEEVMRWHNEHKTLQGFPGADPISNEELLLLPVDILIPAAIENQITKKNAPQIKAPVVVEGANEAITQNANEILFDKGTTVLPGITANAGGVVVSYFEWRKNRGDRPHKVDFEQASKWTADTLAEIMHNTIREVDELSRERSYSLPKAAKILALLRMRDLLQQKHSYLD